MSVDLPEPETPVTQIRPPRGMRTSTFLRLFSRQPFSSRDARLGSTGRRVGGGTMEYSPVRYFRVIESCSADGSAAVLRVAELAAACGDVSSALTGPATTTCPPCAPAPGPMSIR